MNPAVVGALIGAIPGTLAAGLATWASIQASKTNLQQTKFALAGEYSRWMREKRADVYVEMLQYLRNSRMYRDKLLHNEEKVDIDSVQQTAQERIKYTYSSYAIELFAKASAYVSEKADKEFGAAWNSDLDFWNLTQEQLSSENLDFDKLRQKAQPANVAFASFRNTARSDLQELGNELGLPPSSG